MTLTRVAQHAGVSTSTVSRYLRGQLNVQAATAARIDAAVRETGYRAPTPPAPARETDQRVVGLLVPDFVNPFFTALAEEVTALSAARGLTLVVASSTRPNESGSALGRLLDADIALRGIIYVGMSRTDDRLGRAVADGLPAVVIDEMIDLELPVDTVTVDNYGGAYQATSYLIQLGHRRIAHVAGPPELSTTQDRLRGYTDALRDAGLAVEADLVRHGPYTEQFGASTFPHLTRPGTAPTAVFAGSDIVAVGMLGAAELHGLSIPEDLSVVGCDGIRLGQWLRPRLTTLEQPVAALAGAAVDAIERAIARGADDDHAPRRTVLPLHLVIRGSAAPPR